MEQTAAELETTKPTRGQMIWQKIRDARDTAPISLWRARLYTEAFKKTEGMPQPLRIAKSVENVVRNIPIYLDDEQMLAGDPSTWTSGSELHLENSVDWIKRELEAGRPPVGVSDEEVEELKEIVAYWDAKGLKSGFVASLGEETEERLEKVTQTFNADNWAPDLSKEDTPVETEEDQEAEEAMAMTMEAGAEA